MSPSISIFAALADTSFQPNAPSKNAIRRLGYIYLCGVLHASWQTKDGVDGQYLICLMYRDFLLLATAPKVDNMYVVQACIGLSQIRVEDVDNGRGNSTALIPLCQVVWHHRENSH